MVAIGIADDVDADAARANHRDDLVTRDLRVVRLADEHADVANGDRVVRMCVRRRCMAPLSSTTSPGNSAPSVTTPKSNGDNGSSEPI